MEIELVKIIERIFWGILLAESFVGFACLLAAISFWRKSKNNAIDSRMLASEAMKEVHNTIGNFREHKNEAELCQRIQRCGQQMAKRKDGFGHVVAYLLTPKVEHAGIESVIALHFLRVERGAIRLCGFIARTAPLAGLAGTLVGVQQSLDAFSRNPGDAGAVVSGFATALGTTLLGIIVAFWCLSAKAIWEPALTKSMGLLLEAALIVKGNLDELMPNSPVGSQVSVANRQGPRRPTPAVYINPVPPNRRAGARRIRKSQKRNL